MDLTGLPEKKDLEGHSLLPVFKDIGHKREWPAICTHGPDNNVIITRQWRFIQYADGSRELYNREEDPQEWTNLARLEGYDQVMDQLAGYIPVSAKPAPGNNVRLIEMINGEPYWEGEKILQNQQVPMNFK